MMWNSAECTGCARMRMAHELCKTVVKLLSPDVDETESKEEQQSEEQQK